MPGCASRSPSPQPAAVAAPAPARVLGTTHIRDAAIASYAPVELGVRMRNTALRSPGMDESGIDRLIADSATARGGPHRDVTALFAEFMADWLAGVGAGRQAINGP